MHHLHNNNNIQLNKLLEQIYSLLRYDILALKNFIINNASSNIAQVSDIISHLFRNEGKRLRPIIVFLICKIFNYDDDKKIYIAAAIEFVHNATLLHDDVIDESNSRRGFDTVNYIWGNKFSVLVGDFLLTLAFNCSIRCENLDIMAVLSKATSDIVDGELKQMTLSSSIDITQENYINIVSSKTAVLFAAACESAAIISQASDNDIKSLKEFGINLGILFQITDDILDYIAKFDDLGKNIGDDFFNGKVTLPVIIAYGLADTHDEREFWQDVFSTDAIRNKEKFEKALFLIKKHNAIEASYEVANHYRSNAENHILNLKESEFKDILLNLLYAIFYRKF